MTDKELSDSLVKGYNFVTGLCYGLGVAAVYLVGAVSIVAGVVLWYYAP